MDWFLYDNGLRHERVKTIFLAYIDTVLENLKKEIQIFQRFKHSFRSQLESQFEETKRRKI